MEFMCLGEGELQNPQVWPGMIRMPKMSGSNLIKIIVEIESGNMQISGLPRFFQTAKSYFFCSPTANRCYVRRKQCQAQGLDYSSYEGRG